MEVRDGLSAKRAVIHDQAEALGELEFFREDAGGQEQVAEHRLIGGGGFADAGDQFFRDDEQVHGSLRLNVMENDAEVVLVLDLRGDFAVDDALEDGFGHDVKWEWNISPDVSEL